MNANKSIIITFIVDLSCFNFAKHKSINKLSIIMLTYENKTIYKQLDKEQKYYNTMNYLLLMKLSNI